MSTMTPLQINTRISEIEEILPGKHWGPSADGKPAIEFRLAIAGEELAAEYRSLVAERDALETWTTEELRRDFEVTAFAAPFVLVRRRSDGVAGSLQFDHSPRLYHHWVQS